MVYLWNSFPFVSLTCAVVILCTVYAANTGPDDKSTVQMIAAIFRHGDRSPMELYPKDPYINYTWPGGLGALSKKGSLQHFNLGRKLRARYYRLLSKDGQYSKDDVFVRSSDYERCIMSAQSLLAGFMPPMKTNNLLPVSWQPIPVMSLPRILDDLLIQLKPCEKYDNLLYSLSNNPPDDIKKMRDENQDLYQYLTEHTGKNLTTIWDVAILYNTLQIEKDAGLVLPNWTKSVFPDRMAPFQERAYALFTETQYMKKVKGGSLISEVYHNMIKKQEKTLEPNRKIFLYSAHDVTVLSVIRALDVVNQTTSLPDYASALVFELHRPADIDSDLEVKLFYFKNSEVKSPKQVSIPGCDDPCSLTEFGKAVKDLVYDDYDEICENKNPIKLSPVFQL